MSDPTTIPTEGQPASPDAAAPATDEAKPAEGASGVAAEASKTFEEVKKKLSDQISDLGNHVEGLSQKLTDAAGHARQLIEKELESLKAQHPEAFAKIAELRQSGDESLDELRTRLDKLAGDLEKAVSGFVTTLTEQAKKATKSVSSAEAAPAATTDQAAAPTQADATPPADDKAQS